MVIFHGSEDSLDIDAYQVIDKALSISEAKQITDVEKNINLNLITVKNGFVDWCYKGTVDECNNSIFYTYNLHKQEIENPVKGLVPREKSLKTLRTIRGLLSYFSRTEHRSIIKEALRSSDFAFKIKTLVSMDLHKIDDFRKNDIIEVYKFFAFQLAQTYALIKDNEEIFTKSDVKRKYPFLKPYIDREESDVSDLFHFYIKVLSFIDISTNVIEKKYCFFNFESDKIIDVNKECIKND